MTPRELWLHIQEYNEKRRQELEFAIVHAYNTARFYRAKKLPSLKTVLEDMRKNQQPERAQTPEEMLAFAKRFMANLEGKE